MTTKYIYTVTYCTHRNPITPQDFDGGSETFTSFEDAAERAKELPESWRKTKIAEWITGPEGEPYDCIEFWDFADL